MKSRSVGNSEKLLSVSRSLSILPLVVLLAEEDDAEMEPLLDACLLFTSVLILLCAIPFSRVLALQLVTNAIFPFTILEVSNTTLAPPALHNLTLPLFPPLAPTSSINTLTLFKIFSLLRL